MIKNIRFWKLTVLDKLISSDMLKTVSAVLSVIVVIIVSRKFIRVLDKAIAGQISNDTLLSILGLKMLVACVTFLPAATFMAILMVLGRMYRDQEMTAISASGGGVTVIYRAIFVFIFPLSLISTGLSLTVAPWAEEKIQTFTQKDQESADLRGIVEGKFSEYSQGDLVFYVEKIDEKKRLHRIFVQHRQKEKVAIMSAETGRMVNLDDGRYMMLEHGERVLGQAGKYEFTIEKFDEYGVRIDTNDSPIYLQQQAKKAQLLWESKNILDVAEIQRRLAIPLGILLLSFVAVPLAELSPRGGVYGNMLVGFLIYFSYSNLVSVSHTWVIKQTIPAWFGLVGVNLLLIIIGFILLTRLLGRKWLWLRLKNAVNKS